MADGDVGKSGEARQHDVNLRRTSGQRREGGDRAHLLADTTERVGADTEIRAQAFQRPSTGELGRHEPRSIDTAAETETRSPCRDWVIWTLGWLGVGQRWTRGTLQTATGIQRQDRPLDRCKGAAGVDAVDHDEVVLPGRGIPERLGTGHHGSSFSRAGQFRWIACKWQHAGRRYRHLPERGHCRQVNVHRGKVVRQGRKCDLEQCGVVDPQIPLSKRDRGAEATGGRILERQWPVDPRPLSIGQDDARIAFARSTETEVEHFWYRIVGT